MENDCFESISVRLLSLSICLRPPFVRTNRNDHKEARTKYFLENIIHYYDIICLQDLHKTLNSRVTRILATGAEKGLLYSAQSPRSPSTFPVADAGLLVLSKDEILESCFVQFTQTEFPANLSWTGFLYTKIKIGPLFLNMITTQLQPSRSTEDPIQFLKYRHVRRSQLVQIRDFLDRKVADSDFCILTGNLNVDGREDLKPLLFDCVPCQDDYRMLVSILSRQGEIALKDLMREKYQYSPPTYGRTDGGGRPLETTLTAPADSCSNQTLDYILLLGLPPKKFSFCYEECGVVSFKVYDQPFSQISDHAGLQSTFVISR